MSVDRSAIGDGLRRVAEKIRANAAIDEERGEGWRRLPPARWPKDQAERALQESLDDGVPVVRMSRRLRQAVNRKNAELGIAPIPDPLPEDDEYLRSVL